MKELVDFVARSLVDEPDEVRVDEVMDGDITVYELMVAEDDLGKVIGRQGRTARAIRTILSASGTKNQRKYELDIID